MKVTQIEKLNQLISRTDMTGNQKVDWLTNFIDEHVTEQLRLYGVVSSCVDKDELISDLDDRRAVGVEMNEDMWYFYRKQSAEYLLDKYKLLRK